MSDTREAHGTAAKGIDPRGPRFGAGITAILLLVTIALDVSALDLPATILFAVIVVVFAWGTFAGIRRHPWGRVYRATLAKRLGPPSELEDPTPPTFAQGVGFVITGVGLVLHLVGVPHALVIAASLAFIAAFLNSVFAFCLGCQIYLLLARAGIVGRKAAASV